MGQMGAHTAHRCDYRETFDVRYEKCFFCQNVRIKNT